MRTFVAAALAALLAGCAGLPSGTLPALAPAVLPLDGPVTPLAGPVRLPSAAWGPFGQGCIDMRLVMLVGTQPFNRNQRECARLSASPLPDGTVAVSVVRTDLPAGALQASFRRAPTAAISDFEMQGSRIRGADIARRKQDESTLRTLAGLSIDGPTVLRQGDALSDTIAPPGPVSTLLTVNCRIEGASTMAGRAVLVASCTGAAPFSMPPGANGVGMRGRMDIGGLLAMDVATALTTGMALRVQVQGTASGPGGSARVVADSQVLTLLDQARGAGTARLQP
jgi:hypothetical protein